jgi:pimeloyl-ACP methyl ester carboxylesterase
MMTPLKSGLQLAEAIKDARRVVLPGAGHMMMTERPDDVLAALTR